MRLRFAVALSVAALLPMEAPAQQRPPPTDKSFAELIEECMREVRSNLKAGQQLTNAQRMLAEEQCRARAEAAMHNQGNKRKQ